MTKEAYNTLSLFNGMSIGRMATNTTGKYYSCEKDKTAIKASQLLFPDTIQLGDILNWREWDLDWSSIGLVTGGFPCQSWSLAGKGLGDKDPRGALFWVMLDIIKHVKSFNPSVRFLLENVKMKRDFEEYITYHTEEALGVVHKTLINSSLVVPQNRERYYWTSSSILPVDEVDSCTRDIMEPLEGRKVLSLKDNKRWKVVTENSRGFRPHRGDKRSSGISELGRIVHPSAKTGTLTTSHAPKIAINSDLEDLKYVEATAVECMRLQSIPEKYIEVLINSDISSRQLIKLAGNAWTMKIIKHIKSQL